MEVVTRSINSKKKKKKQGAEKKWKVVFLNTKCLVLATPF